MRDEINLITTADVAVLRSNWSIYELLRKFPNLGRRSRRYSTGRYLIFAGTCHDSIGDHSSHVKRDRLRGTTDYQTELQELVTADGYGLDASTAQAMASDWKLLRHASTGPSIPPLLVRHQFGRSNYKLWMTDLTHIWAEALDQRPLVQRAWNLEADIDPIESDQRQMLLHRIKDSLDEAQGTKLVISRTDDFDGIVLTACTPLPKPLKPLRWPFYLALSPRTTLSNELVLPLLGEQLLFRKKIASLLATTKDKDHVIAKLTDKLQAEGIELGKVFPGAISSKSTRKASSKEDIGKYVRGLGPFDEAQWQTHLSDNLDIPRGCSSLLSQLFSPGATLNLPRIDEQLSDRAWWEQIGTRDRPVDDESESTLQSRSQDSTSKDFQRQPTPADLDGPTTKGHPPSTKMTLLQRESNPHTTAQETTSDGSTTETSDDDLDPIPPKAPESEQPSKPVVEHNTSSSSASSPEPVGKSSQHQSPKLRGTLGRIGGTSKPSLPSSKPKLGKIGGISDTARPLKPEFKSPEPRGRSPVQKRSPSSPRETSQERADKKREQLKRELAEKSRLGAKKKRKF
ncbi:MAG: hypothetical protein Q9188_000381 [Gyalolechia gomerana]